MRADHNLVLFRVLYFSLYLADALLSPFFSLYYQSLGFSSLEQGILLASVPFSLFLGALIYSFFATSYRRNLLLIKIALFLESLGIVGFALSRSFPLVLVFSIFLALNNAAAFQLLDASSSIAFKKHGESFSKVRIFGSLAYVIALALASFLLKSVAYLPLFLAAAGLCLVSFFLSLFLYAYDEVFERKKGETGLAKNRNFWLYLLYYVFLCGSVGVNGYILPLYLKSLGFSDSSYSLFYALRVAFEVAVVFFFPFLLKAFKGYRNCLIVGGTLYFLSILTPFFSSDPSWVMGLNSVLRGTGNGFIIVAGVGYLHGLLGDEAITRALIYSSLGLNLFTGIGNLVSPSLVEAIGYSSYFILFASLSAVGLLFLFFLKRIYKSPAE